MYTIITILVTKIPAFRALMSFKKVNIDLLDNPFKDTYPKRVET